MQRAKILYKRVLITVGALLFANQLIADDAQIIAGIKNLKTPAPNYYSAGQPTAAELTALAGAGVKHVINLRPPQKYQGSTKSAW